MTANALCQNIVSNSDLFVDKTHVFGGQMVTKIGDLIQYMTVGQLSFPLVSSVSALFYMRCKLHSASLLRLSVHPSVCPSVGLS